MEEELIGIVKLFAGNFTPRNYLECDGRLLPIREYQALFALLADTYGGDRQTTFALPKLDRIGQCRYIICVKGIFPSRD